MTPHPVGALLLLFCTNKGLREPNKWTTEQRYQQLYVDSYLGSSGEDIKAKEHIVGLLEHQQKGGFHLTE